MSVRSFFDTNILIYADDNTAPAKRERALDLLGEHRRAGTGVLSLQVLQEYFVAVTRKLHLEPRIEMQFASHGDEISLQVLQEYFVAVTRKLHLDPRLARRKVELLAEFDVVAPDVTDILAAIDLHRLHQLSFWDALILRAAKQGGCGTVFSEN